MQGTAEDYERQPESIWELKEVSRSLVSGWFAGYAQSFPFVRVGCPLVAHKHGCEETVVCEVQEGQDDLRQVGY